MELIEALVPLAVALIQFHATVEAVGVGASVQILATDGYTHWIQHEIPGHPIPRHDSCIFNSVCQFFQIYK